MKETDLRAIRGRLGTRERYREANNLPSQARDISDLLKECERLQEIARPIGASHLCAGQALFVTQIYWRGQIVQKQIVVNEEPMVQALEDHVEASGGAPAAVARLHKLSSFLSEHFGHGIAAALVDLFTRSRGA